VSFRRVRRVLFVTLAVVAASWPLAVLAQAPFPAHRGAVNDFVGVMTSEELARLEAISRELHAKTTAALVVAVVPSHAPFSLEDYATQLFRHWGIGERGKDNGVLILLAMQERLLGIEVGYGMEEAVTDARAGQIRDLMIPHFTQGNFARGLETGMRAAAVVMASKYNVTLESTGDLRVRDLEPRPGFPWLLLGGIPLLGLVTMGLSRSLAAKCPKCRARLLVTHRVLSEATLNAGGLAVKVCQCPKCGYSSQTRYRTPRMIPVQTGPVVGGGGPMWGGGRSGRGGGFGGFGGFGGGRSGGGGARGRF